MFKLNPYHLQHASLVHFLMLQGMALLAYRVGWHRFRRKKKQLEQELNDLLIQLDACSVLEVDAVEVFPDHGPEDLKEIYGITSNLAKLLNDHGIFRFAQLAETPVATLKGILASHGPMLFSYDPVTWPTQARLAQQGRWAELRRWQQEMRRGNVTNYSHLLPK